MSIMIDLHRDASIEAYKKHDFMHFTHVMLQVSKRLHCAQFPDIVPCTWIRLDLAEHLNIQFPRDSAEKSELVHWCWNYPIHNGFFDEDELMEDIVKKYPTCKSPLFAFYLK